MQFNVNNIYYALFGNNQTYSVSGSSKDSNLVFLRIPIQEYHHRNDIVNLPYYMNVHYIFRHSYGDISNPHPSTVELVEEILRKQTHSLVSQCLILSESSDGSNAQSSFVDQKIYISL